MQRYLLIFGFLLISGTTLAATSMSQLQLLIAKKDFAAAAEYGELLLQQNPGHARTRFLTAYAHQMSDNPKRAVVLYEAMIQDNSELPEPRNNLAMIYLAQGDYDRASELLVDAINTHSSYAIAYSNLRQVYKGIASEAYQRAVNESGEPTKPANDIKLIAITWLDVSDAELEQIREPAPDIPALAAQKPEAPTPIALVTEEPSVVNVANQETLLIEQVKNWARAWSDKDFDAYTGFYSPQHSAKFATHEQWIEHRRKRIMKPGEISIEVSDFQITWQGGNQASADFEQAFASARYSDRVKKRLVFTLIDSQWKISEERVLSVL